MIEYSLANAPLQKELSAGESTLTQPLFHIHSLSVQLLLKKNNKKQKKEKLQYKRKKDEETVHLTLMICLSPKV